MFIVKKSMMSSHLKNKKAQIYEPNMMHLFYIFLRENQSPMI